MDDGGESKANVTRSRAYAGFAWQSASVVLGASTTLIFLAVMGRLLNPGAFGEFGLANVVIAVSFELGFGLVLVQRRSIPDNEVGFVLTMTLLLAGLAALALVLLSPTISAAFEGKVDPRVLQVLSFDLVLRTVGTVPRSLLIRDLDFKSIFWISNISYLVGNLGVGLLVALNDGGVWALVFGLVAGNILTQGAFFVKRPIRPRISIHRGAAKEILGFGVGMSGVSVLNQLAQGADKLVLGRALSLEQFGFYERGQQMHLLPGAYLGSAVDGPFYAVLSRVAERSHLLGRFFFSSVALLASGMMYVAVFTLFFAETITALLLGSGWDDAASVLRILALSMYIRTYPRFVDTLVRSLNKFHKLLPVKLGFLFAVGSLSLLGLHLGGLTGALIGINIAQVVHGILSIDLARRLTARPAADLILSLFPQLLLGSMMIAKNLAVFGLVDSTSERLIGVIATDVALVALYFKIPGLLGRNNARFLADRLFEIGGLPGGVAERWAERHPWLSPATPESSL